VGDIGPDVSVEELRAAFQDDESDHVEARIVMDPSSGRTKGYGFVTFADPESATKALSKNGEILKGRKMRVNWASTNKDSKSSTPTNIPPPQVVPAGVPTAPGQFMVPDQSYVPVRNDAQIQLSTMAAYDGLDVSWYLRLSTEHQNGILRVSNEAPGAKVVWIGNLDKATSRMILFVMGC
jgi:RNA recognition motif. (a.k.a. RRM, RBD, or RNP domain)